MHSFPVPSVPTRFPQVTANPYLPGSAVIACTVPKNRQGKPGAKFGLDFEGHYQRWRDSAEQVGHNHGGGFGADAGFN